MDLLVARTLPLGTCARAAPASASACPRVPAAVRNCRLVTIRSARSVNDASPPAATISPISGRSGGLRVAAQRVAQHLPRQRLITCASWPCRYVSRPSAPTIVVLVVELAGEVDRLAVGVGSRACGPRRRSPRAGSPAGRCAGGTWRTRASRLCCASLSRSVCPPKPLSSAGSVPASAGAAASACRGSRRRIQSPRLTGLVRSGADVVVSTAPSRSAPPRSNARAPSTRLHAAGRAHRSVDAVEFRERLVQERVIGVQDLLHRTSLPDDVLEGRDGLVVHRPLHLVGELREASRVDAAILVEVVEAEPLAEELGRQPARLRVGGHAPDLAGELRRVAQLARRSGAPQLVVGDRGPEEEAQPARHLPVVQRRFGGRRRGLDAIEEGGRHQDARQRAPARAPSWSRPMHGAGRS